MWLVFWFVRDEGERHSVALCGAFVQYKSPNVFYAMVLAIMLTIISVTGSNEDVYNFLSVVAVCFLHCALSVVYFPCCHESTTNDDEKP